MTGDPITEFRHDARLAGMNLRGWRNDDAEQVVLIPPKEQVPRYGEIATALADLGYLPVPIIPGEKRPLMEEWQHWRHTDVNAGQYANGFTGILTGHGCIAIDMDVTDPELAEVVDTLARQCLGKAPIRVGKAPKRLRLYRYAGEIRKQSLSLGAAGKIEIMGTGQQVVAFAIHPDTREPYRWTTTATPLNTHCEDLTPVEQRHLDAFLAAVLKACPEAVAAKSHAERTALAADERWSEPILQILSGEELHDSIRDTAAAWIGAGMPPGAVVQALRSIVAQSSARSARPDEWQDRYDDIPRAVASAERRFAPSLALDDAPGACTSKRERLRPKTVSEMLSRPVLPDLVRGLLPMRGLAVIYGQSGDGKTFLVLSLAMAVSLGRKWFGRRVKQRGVIYVQAEGNVSTRVRAFLEDEELGAEALDCFRVVDSSVNLLDPKADLPDLLEALNAAAGEMGGVGLVIVDTLSRVIPGGNDIEGGDIGNVIACAKRIEDACGCLVLFVHHSGKDLAKGARGHSSLKAATDTEIEVKADASGLRTATATKVREGATGQAINFTLRVVDLGPLSGVDPDAEPDERLNSCVVDACDETRTSRTPMKLTAAGRVGLTALRDLIGECGQTLPGTSTIPAGVRGAYIDQWRSRFLTAYGEESSSTADSRKRAFARMKDDLLKAGAIAMSDPFVWVCR